MDIQELLSDRSGIVENVEILNTFGNSLNIDISPGDIDEFIETFEQSRDNYRPNIKVDHSAHQALLKSILGIDEEDSEIPNIGFIDNMRREGNSLIADIVEIPARLIDLLFRGQFKGVSPEFYQNYRGTGKKFIEAVALTNYPRLKHQYNLSEINGDAEGSELKFSGQINIKDEVTKMSDITKQDLEKVESNIFTKLSEFFKKEDKGEKTDMSEITAMRQEIDALKNQLTDKDESIKKFSDTFSIMRNRARKDSVDAICMSALAKGVKQSTIDHFKPLLMSDHSESVIKFSDVQDGQSIETEKSVTDVIVDFFETQKGKIDFADRTATGVIRPGSPELEDKAKAIEENGRKYFSEFKSQGMSDVDAWDKAIDKAYEN